VVESWGTSWRISLWRFGGCRHGGEIFGGAVTRLVTADDLLEIFFLALQTAKIRALGVNFLTGGN
jgi:hypothetical protein